MRAQVQVDTTMDLVEKFSELLTGGNVDGNFMVYQDEDSFYCESEFTVEDERGFADSFVQFRVGFPCEGFMNDFKVEIEDDSDRFYFEKMLTQLVSHTMLDLLI